MGLSFPGSRAVREQPAPCGPSPSGAGYCPGLYWNSAAVSTSSEGDPLIRSVARTGGLPCWLGLLLMPLLALVLGVHRCGMPGRLAVRQHKALLFLSPCPHPIRSATGPPVQFLQQVH